MSLETLFLEMLNMALPATWMMAAVILFRALLKKRLPRRVMMVGWGLVAMRLICPFSIESVFSLIPSGNPIPLDIPYADTPAVDLGVPILDRPVNGLLADTMTPAAGASVNPMQVVVTVAAWVWVIGVMALVAYSVLSYPMLRRRMRTAVLLREGDGECSAIPAEAVGGLPRHATLWQCERVKSPFILGVFRPRVYIPYGMDGETAAHVLAHETAHLRRWDHIIKLAAFLLCAVYWFYPPIWVCYALFCRDMEAACDERVVKHLDKDGRRAYAHALLSCGHEQRVRLFCPPAFGESGVKARIKGVLSYKKPVLWVVIVALLLLAVLGVFLLTDPAEDYANIPSDWYGINNISDTDCAVQSFGLVPVDFMWENGRITGIRMRLENRTDGDIEYGDPFNIYREVDGEWINAAVTDTTFHLLGYALPPDKTVTKVYDVTRYDLSVYGRYRFVISINAPINEYGATENYEAAFEFTVAGSDELASPHPADFAIRFSAQIGEVPNVLDTFDGYIQKDLVLATPNRARIEYTHTEAELQYLWYLVESHGITDMPPDMHPGQTGGEAFGVTPNTEYTITIRANGHTYTVTGDSATGMIDKKENKQFKSFVAEMYNFLFSTGQWQRLPDAKGGYD